MKWWVHKTKCRKNYRDCCLPKWEATPPEEDCFYAYEFNTWIEAINFVRQRIAEER